MYLWSVRCSLWATVTSTAVNQSKHDKVCLGFQQRICHSGVYGILNLLFTFVGLKHKCSLTSGGRLAPSFIEQTLCWFWVERPFYLQNCLNSLWQRFNYMLETFLRGSGPHWHNSSTQLMHICWPLLHDVSPPHLKGALWDWDLVSVEAIRTQWTYCCVQETSVRYELCGIGGHPAESSHWKMGTLCS